MQDLTRQLAALRDVEGQDPDAAEAEWLVFGDSLLERGDRRGELVALTAAEARATDAAEAERIRDRIQTLTAELEPQLWRAAEGGVAELEWRYGFVREARLVERWHDETPTARVLLERLVTTEVGQMLGVLAIDRELPGDVAMGLLGTKGVFDWAIPIFEGLEGRVLPHARELHLGAEPPSSMYLNRGSNFMFTSDAPGRPGATISRPYPYLGDPEPLLRAMPNLTELRITGECLRIEDGAALARSLRSLTIETRFLRASTLAAIGAADLPELESLELWLGHFPDSAPRFEGPSPEAYFGRATGPADLVPILGGDRLPKLRHLALTSCAWMSDAVLALAESAIAPRLETLDLSYGFMDAGQVEPLLRARSRFTRLRRIDLSYNQIYDAATLARLREAFGATLLLGRQDDLAGDAVMGLLAFPDD